MSLVWTTLQVFVLFLAVHINCFRLEKPEDPITPQLKFLASVDGKSYFYDDGVKNRTGADELCKSLGLQLATITTNAQWQTLISAYSSDFDMAYWTSGRDAHKLRQFSWDASNNDASVLNLRFNNYYDIPFATCLAFMSVPNKGSYLYPRQCDLVTVRTLCETL